jgi:hypothetical protein
VTGKSRVGLPVRRHSREGGNPERVRDAVALDARIQKKIGV